LRRAVGAGPEEVSLGYASGHSIHSTPIASRLRPRTRLVRCRRPVHTGARPRL